MGCTFADAKRKYEAAKNDLLSCKETINELTVKKDSLQDDYILRTKRWKESRNKNSALVELQFREYLKKKNFFGNVIFDHDKKALFLNVQTDVNNTSGANSKDVRNLSGGERSYVSLCLLLALGHVVRLYIYNILYI